jgi:tRNA (guanine37-N1)-methyltransferase
MMVIDVLTLFPEMFKGPFEYSIIKKARDKGLVEINLVNIRDFSTDKHKKVDDYPYGGGPGMVLKPEPLFNAVEHLKGNKFIKQKTIFMTPQGKLLNQDIVRELSKLEHIIIVCGHYEGVDERVRQCIIDEEISIGDYVLTGGELPAMVLIDAVARMIPGVVGHKEGVYEESFITGLLEYPQYTRPRNFRGMEVPEVLLSGDHKKIREWRLKQALKRTYERRPDLLEDRKLRDEEVKILGTLKNEGRSARS